MPHVVFARINRRNPAAATLTEHSFQQDMHILADAGALEAPSPTGTEWIAADLELDPSGDFLIGILGFVEEETLRDYAREVRSWKKGETRTEVGASRRTLTPFAIDTRDDQRWVAFVRTSGIRPRTFVTGFQYVLQLAVGRYGLLPADWEVDLIASTTTVLDWLAEHPDVSRLTRVVKVPNPGRDLTEEIDEMRKLAARRKTENFTPSYGATLDVERDRELLRSLVEGVDRGNVEIRVATRAGDTFDSARELEEAEVPNWGEDWDRAQELVLRVLRVYVEGRPEQGRLGEGSELV